MFVINFHYTINWVFLSGRLLLLSIFIETASWMAATSYTTSCLYVIMDVIIIQHNILLALVIDGFPLCNLLIIAGTAAHQPACAWWYSLHHGYFSFKIILTLL